jgi:ABC-type transporter Mla subunit MlaD
MNQATPQRFKFQYANEIVGSFMLLTLLALVITAVAVSRSKKWMEPTKRIVVTLPVTSLGMKEGAPVQMAGMGIGIVERIHADELGNLTADVTLKGDYIRFIRNDSKFTVKRAFVLYGDPYLDITLGQGVELADRAVVAAASDPEASDYLTDVRGTLANLQQISGTIARGEGLAGRLFTSSKTATDFDKIIPEVNNSLTDVNAVVKDLRKTSASLSDLANQETRQLPAVMEETHQTLEQIKVVLQDLQKTTAKLPEVVASTNSVLADVHKTTDKLPQVMESVQVSVQGLPPLLLQVQETMRQTERLVEGIQHHWLVSSYVEPDTTGKRIRPDDVGGGGQ